MSGDFRQRRRCRTWQAYRTGRRAGGVEDVVGGVHLMRRSGNLEQTPGLIDADVTDDEAFVTLKSS